MARVESWYQNLKLRVVFKPKKSVRFQIWLAIKRQIYKTIATYDHKNTY